MMTEARSLGEFRDWPLFMPLRAREGCVVQRPGDPEPGWWLLLRENELRELIAAYDDVRERLGVAETVMETVDADDPDARAQQAYDEWLAEARNEARAQAMEP